MNNTMNHNGIDYPLLTKTAWNVTAEHNYLSMVSYIDQLFSKHSRLLIIRVDLMFRDNTQGQYDAEFSRVCFQRLLNNSRRNRIFDNMVGYVWALEYGQNRGFHYHCLFIYNGSRSQQDITIGHEIGRYWMDMITEGTGTYYVSNDRKAYFEQQGTLGIGMIHRHDAVRRENLIRSASYLLKDDGLIQQMLPESHRRFRTFGRGEIAL